MKRIALFFMGVATVSSATSLPLGSPFQVLDPQTGKPISSSTLLTFPNGKTMKAGEYYQQLNEMENRLRTMGQSLTIENDHLGELPSSSVEADKLDRQKARILARNLELDKNPKLQLPRHAGTQANTPDEAGIAPTNHVVLPAELKCSNNSSKTRSWNYNNSNSLFAAAVSADLDITGNCQNLTAKADADASGKIFGASFNLVNATMMGTSAKGGNSTGSLDVKVLGMDVVNRNYNLPAISVGDTYRQNVTYSGGFHFMVGPVPLNIAYGLGGKASFTWNATLNPSSAFVTAHPGTGTWVYAQGGVDIAAAGADVGTNLTLLNVDLNGQASMQVTVENQVVGFAGNTFLSYGINALSGSVYADAWMYVPKFGIPPWTKKSWRDDLFAWAGFHDNRTLINENSWTPLI